MEAVGALLSGSGRNWPLRCCGAMCLIAAIVEEGTVLAIYYCALAWALVRVSAGRNLPVPVAGGLRLVCWTAWPLLVKVVWHGVCAAGWSSRFFRTATAFFQLLFSGAPDQKDSCAHLRWASSEAMLGLVALVHWQLCCNDSARSAAAAMVAAWMPPVWRDSLPRSSQDIEVVMLGEEMAEVGASAQSSVVVEDQEDAPGASYCSPGDIEGGPLLVRCKMPALLMICGALDTNIFAVGYHAAALCAVLDLAGALSGRKGGLFGRCADVAVLHLAVGSVAHFLIPMLAAHGVDMRGWLAKFFLAPPADGWTTMQHLVLLLLLAEYWHDTRRPKPGMPRGPPPPPLQIIEAVEGAVAFSASPPAVDVETPDVRAGKSEVSEVAHAEVFTPATVPSPTRPLAYIDTPSLGFWRRAVSFEVVSVETAGSLTGDDSDPWASLPAIVSFVGWLFVWPSLPSLPLLVAGLVALSAPLRPMPHSMLVAAAQYQATVCFMCYLYAVWCEALGVPGWWGPQLGVLDLGDARGRIVRALVLAALPALLMVLACGARRTLRPPHRPPERMRFLEEIPPAAVSWALFLARACSVGLVLTLALGRGPHSTSSLVQLGYLCWLLGLLHVGEELSSAVIGWDVIRGSPKVWLSLLWYSGATGFCALCWRALNIRDIAWLGFARWDSFTQEATLIARMWPHLVLSLLASVQAHALRYPSAQPDHTRLTQVPWVVQKVLVVIQFVLLLLMALMEPVSIDSFMFLILFMGNVLVVSFKMRPALLLPLISMSSDLTWDLLAIRSLLVLHPVQEWLVVVLPQSEYPLTWSTLDLAASEVRATRQVLMVLLLLYSRALTGLLEPALLRLDEQLQAPLPAATVELLRMLRGWSPCVLILVVHELAASVGLTFLSWVQLNLALFLLLSGHNWGQAGCIFSACTCCCLVLQYLHRFSFCHSWPPPAEVTYWGIMWQPALVQKEFSVLFLSVIQRAIHCKVASIDATESATQAVAEAQPAEIRTPTSTVPTQGQGLQTLDAQLGAVVLLFFAVLRDRAWSIPAVLAVAGFCFSGDAYRELSVPRARFWLRVFAAVLLSQLVFVLMFEVGAPPFMGVPRQNAEDLMHWSICAGYDPEELPRLPNGTLCNPMTLPEKLAQTCIPQRMRCGQEWLAWLGVGGQPGHFRRVPEFTLFLMLCLLAAESRGHRTLRPIAMRVVEWSRGWHAKWKVSTIYFAFALEWTALMGSLLAKRTSDAVAVASLWLLLYTLSMWGNAALKSNPMRAMNMPMRLISSLNFGVILAMLAFQCPSVPCPHSMKLAANTVTFYMSRQQCVEVAARGVWTLSGASSASTFAHCFGLMKIVGFNDWESLWRLFIFVSALSQRLLIFAFKEELESHLQIERRRFRKRNQWYIKQVAALREVQLTAWDTKRLVLLSKLRRLIAQHDNFRAIWDGRRQAFSAAEEEERCWANRVEDLCLLSGIGRQKVEGLLVEFDVAASHSGERSATGAGGERSIAGGGSADVVGEGGYCLGTPAGEQGHAERFRQIADRRLLEYLEQHTLRMKRMITADEEKFAKRKLLDACRVDCLALLEEHVGEERPLTDLPRKSVITLRNFLASKLVPTQSDASMSQDSSSGGPVPELRHSSPVQMAELERPMLSPRIEQDERGEDTDAAPSPRPESNTEAGEVETNILYNLLQRLLCEAIDDLLFIRSEDETLHQHRHGNGLLVLACKALGSQTVPLVCLAAMLQFVMYRSALAAISVSIVVLSLMSFPHIPFALWVVLLRFNTCVVFAKMFFQLPIICADGKLNISPNKSCVERACSVTWLMMAGLYKVGGSPVDPGCGPMHYDSLRSVLWADLFVCVAVLLNMLVARYSGRCHSGLELLQILRSKDSAARGDAVSVELELRQEHMGSGGYLCESEHSGAWLDGWTDTSGMSLRFRLLRAWQDFRERVRDVSQVVFDGRMRRPAKDFYAIRFFMHMIILVLVMLAWSTLMNTSRSFSVSLLTNNFDGAQVRVLIVGVILAVADRILYAWYRTHPWLSSEEEALFGASDSELGTSIRSPRIPQQAEQQVYKGYVEAFGSHRVMAGTIQKVLLIVELAYLHYFFVKMWTKKSVKVTTMELFESNQTAVATIFYILCLAYLALTSLQMKYDVHVMRGGMRFTHSTDLVTKNLFRAYNVMPFLHELRVLTDWTITPTSMDFFMWMKFEDAYHILYQTRCDMEARRQTAQPGHPQPLWMKVGVGAPMLFAMLALLCGPVVWFSSLNVLGFQTNVVKRARLDISLELEKLSCSSRKMNLYSGEPGIVMLEPDDYSAFFDTDKKRFVQTEVRASRQKAVFPVHSDSFSMVPRETMQKMQVIMTDQSQEEAWKVKLILHFMFEREHTMNAHHEEVIELTDPADIEQLARFLSAPDTDEHSSESPMQRHALSSSRASGRASRLTFRADFNTVLLLTASSRAAPLPSKRSHEMTMSLQMETEGNSDRLVYWSFGVHGPEEDDEDTVTPPTQDDEREVTVEPPAPTEQPIAPVGQLAQQAADEGRLTVQQQPALRPAPRQLPLEVFLMSDDIAKASVSSEIDEEAGGPGVSMKSLYLGVVLTVGSLLRSLFKLSSQRVIYEEMPNTDLLLDLCNGVYIARIQGNLEVEWKLYHELIRIYRSPEVVLRVTAPKALDDEDLPRGRKANAPDRWSVAARSAASRSMRRPSHHRRSPSPASLALQGASSGATGWPRRSPGRDAPASFKPRRRSSSH